MRTSQLRNTLSLVIYYFLPSGFFHLYSRTLNYAFHRLPCCAAFAPRHLNLNPRSTKRRPSFHRYHPDRHRDDRYQFIVCETLNFSNPNPRGRSLRDRNPHVQVFSVLGLHARVFFPVVFFEVGSTAASAVIAIAVKCSTIVVTAFESLAVIAFPIVAFTIGSSAIRVMIRIRGTSLFSP